MILLFIATYTFPEISVSKTTDVPVATMLERVRQGLRPQDRKRTEVLYEDDHIRVIYEQIKLPVIEDRDYVIRTEKFVDEATGTITLAFKAQDHPRVDRHVRMEHIQGKWVFTPQGHGHTRVTYVCSSDPGGGIPPFMAVPKQRELAAALLEELTRAI